MKIEPPQLAVELERSTDAAIAKPDVDMAEGFEELIEAVASDAAVAQSEGLWQSL